MHASESGMPVDLQCLASDDLGVEQVADFSEVGAEEKGYRFLNAQDARLSIKSMSTPRLAELADVPVDIAEAAQAVLGDVLCVAQFYFEDTLSPSACQSFNLGASWSCHERVLRAHAHLCWLTILIDDVA